MENQNNLSRKEREKLQKRSEILKAAKKLFASKGFNSATLDDIAMEAEFGKGTIYNYFSSKDEIIKVIVEDVLVSNLEAIKKADAEGKNFEEFITLYTREMFGYCLENQEAFILLAEHYINQMKVNNFNKDRVEFIEFVMQTSEIMQTRIMKGISENEIIELNTLHFSILYQNMVFPFILDLIYHKQIESLSIDEHVAMLKEIIFKGISKDNLRKL
ncbi:MAG: TetR/AcrR family transcriptional regulator [Ignavibacteria bacterium]|nr:TetR/AcrR family transcriptional regulator [Ignavibacteria bacterium]